MNEIKKWIENNNNNTHSDRENCACASFEARLFSYIYLFFFVLHMHVYVCVGVRARVCRTRLFDNNISSFLHGFRIRIRRSAYTSAYHAQNDDNHTPHTRRQQHTLHTRAWAVATERYTHTHKHSHKIVRCHTNGHTLRAPSFRLFCFYYFFIFSIFETTKAHAVCTRSNWNFVRLLRFEVFGVVVCLQRNANHVGWLGNMIEHASRLWKKKTIGANRRWHDICARLCSTESKPKNVDELTNSILASAVSQTPRFELIQQSTMIVCCIQLILHSSSPFLIHIFCISYDSSHNLKHSNRMLAKHTEIRMRMEEYNKKKM